MEFTKVNLAEIDAVVNKPELQHRIINDTNPCGEALNIIK